MVVLDRFYAERAWSRMALVLASLTVLWAWAPSTLVAREHSQTKTTAQPVPPTSITVSVTASVQSPSIVKAGETFNFSINLDRGSSVEGTVVQFAVIAPNGLNISTSTSTLRAGQSHCEASIVIPAAAPAGKWRLHILGLFTGIDQRPLKAEDTTFEVIANDSLEFPSAAVVTVNPSQEQLLRTEAVHLQRRIQAFKIDISQPRANSDLREILDGTVRQSLATLDSTEESFRRLSSTSNLDVVATAFFSDLRRNYKDVLAGLGTRAMTWGSKWPSIVSVGWRQEQKTEQPYPPAAHAVLRSLEQNELAYSVVAVNKSLTFDLEVDSLPEGASIAFRRKGDPYTQHQDPTNSTIKSLVYAIWQIKIHKSGYQDAEIEHDPFREPNHKISVALQK